MEYSTISQTVNVGSFIRVSINKVLSIRTFIGRELFEEVPIVTQLGRIVLQFQYYSVITP